MIELIENKSINKDKFWVSLGYNFSLLKIKYNFIYLNLLSKKIGPEHFLVKIFNNINFCKLINYLDILLNSDYDYSTNIIQYNNLNISINHIFYNLQKYFDFQILFNFDEQNSKDKNLLKKNYKQNHFSNNETEFINNTLLETNKILKLCNKLFDNIKIKKELIFLEDKISKFSNNFKMIIKQHNSYKINELKKKLFIENLPEFDLNINLNEKPKNYDIIINSDTNLKDSIDINDIEVSENKFIYEDKTLFLSDLFDENKNLSIYTIRNSIKKFNLNEIINTKQSKPLLINQLKQIKLEHQDDTQNDIQNDSQNDIANIKNIEIPIDNKQCYINSRPYQSKLRYNAFINFNNKCIISGRTEKRLLEACHIKPDCECEAYEKIDNDNILLLWCDIHIYFDLYEVSINPENQLFYINQKSECYEYFKSLGFEYKKINNLSEKNKLYLIKHFEKFNQNL